MTRRSKLAAAAIAAALVTTMGATSVSAAPTGAPIQAKRDTGNWCC